MYQSCEKFSVHKNGYGLMPGTILNALPKLAHFIPVTVPRGAFHRGPHLIDEKRDTRAGSVSVHVSEGQSWGLHQSSCAQRLCLNHDLCCLSGDDSADVLGHPGGVYIKSDSLKKKNWSKCLGFGLGVREGKWDPSNTPLYGNLIFADFPSHISCCA